MKKIKFIKRQDSGFKLSYGNSGETSLNLSNEIFDFISQGSLNLGEERAITFRVYKEDCIKAMSFVIMKLPLYKTSSNYSNKVISYLDTFAELYSKIEAYFGSNKEAEYKVSLFYRPDGRIYLKGLRVNGFSIRDYLVENYSALQFDDEGASGGMNLRILSDIEENGENDDSSDQTKGVIDVSQISSLYRPYITAIKSKPFLLLAGISGTGKSRIVRELARACWEEGSEEYNSQKPRNFEMVQVKPNWHDSSELIGYVSRVSGNPAFVAGDFLKFIAKAWGELDVPYILCLDEMNLAPVEQYFAEYLSVVESRKADADGKVTTDPIVKKVSEEWYWKLCRELTSDEELRVQFRDEGICLPQNLIVVGTVNMDETTFSFSRKVLDRAMTIEMNEVNLKGGLRKRHEEIGRLGAAELIGTAVEGVDVFEAYHDVCKTTINYLQAINDKLEGTPFKIAYRTRNEFLLYVVNNLPYKQENETQGYVIARALDEITSMKILSRIEGDTTKVSREFLEELKKVVAEELNHVSGEEYSSKKDEDDKTCSVSLAKLEEMKDRLKSGYTSFWS